MIEKKLFQTSDGSFSLACEGLNETYHSRHGALQESQYVYIDMGLAYWRKSNPEALFCRVFEMGFGTGLNMLLAASYAQEKKLKMYFETVENEVLPRSLHEQLHYADHFPALATQEARMDLLVNHWDLPFSFLPEFQCLKKNQDYFKWNPTENFEVIFYDAFGAHAQSEMWETKALERSLEYLNKGGVWVSYCAKGSVRRSLEALGMRVERLAGPPGKREMLRAVKPE